MGKLKIVAVAVLTACGATEQAKDGKLEQNQRESLRTVYAEKVESLRGVGWLTTDDCDAMLWSGKAGVARELGFDPTLAEAEPGKFWRRPIDKPCWTPEGGDQGAKTTWSRDMLVCGLLPWALLVGDRGLLERHIAYGEANGWLMGDPVADGRAVYTPGLIAMLYQARRQLGGPDHGAIYVPQIWQPGLVDYEAHLQMCSACLAIEMDGSLPVEAWELVESHVSRETNSVFYQYLNGRRTGDQAATYEALLKSELPLADYQRKPIDAVADWIFVSYLLLR